MPALDVPGAGLGGDEDVSSQHPHGIAPPASEEPRRSRAASPAAGPAAPSGRPQPTRPRAGERVRPRPWPAHRPGTASSPSRSAQAGRAPGRPPLPMPPPSGAAPEGGRVREKRGPYTGCSDTSRRPRSRPAASATPAWWPSSLRPAGGRPPSQEGVAPAVDDGGPALPERPHWLMPRCRPPDVEDVAHVLADLAGQVGEHAADVVSLTPG